MPLDLPNLGGGAQATTPSFQPLDTNIGVGHGFMGGGSLADSEARQRSLLGPTLGGLLPEGFLMRRSDVPLFETNLNMQQRDAALQNRQQGLNRLEGARNSVGISPESTLAREMAVERVRGGGAFGADQVERRLGAVKSRGAAAAGDARRELAGSLASRGLGGGIPAAALAGFEQQMAVDVAGQMADAEYQAALAQDEAERMNLAQLNDIAAEEELRRIALDQMIADTLIGTQYEPIDLSGLLGAPPGGGALVGSGA